MSGDLTEQDAERSFGYLPMRDGVRLAYVLWRSKGAPGCPTLLSYSVYSESGSAFADVKRFLEAGYAYVGANVRGTGASEGTFSYLQPAEAEDGAALVEWIARQPWSSGSVGMIGASYGAHTQIAVAALRPPHLKAIVAVSIDGDEYRDEAMPGGLFNVGMASTWTLEVHPQMSQIGVDVRIAGGDMECSTIRARQPPNRTYDEIRQHPLRDDWWKARSLEQLVAEVRVPTLIIQAWQDEWIRPNGALELFSTLKSTARRLVLQNGPHRLSRNLLTQREQMRWLDRWVKAEQNGVEAEPPVKVCWEVTGTEGRNDSEPNWTTSHEDWPPTDLRWDTFYLTPTGELSAEMPCVSAPKDAVRSYVYPLGTELVGSTTQFSVAPATIGTLSYRTAPMTSDAVILGAPELKFFFSSDQLDTDFMFVLHDVSPAGRTLFLQRSVLRASLRKVDSARSASGELVQTFDEIQQLIPGEIYEIALSLSALGHVVRKGHCLEFSILSPPQVPNPVWAFAAPFNAATNRIYHGEKHPSALRLPVMPNAVALQPAAPWERLLNLPCR